MTLGPNQTIAVQRVKSNHFPRTIERDALMESGYFFCNANVFFLVRSYLAKLFFMVTLSVLVCIYLLCLKIFDMVDYTKFKLSRYNEIEMIEFFKNI